MSANDTKPEVSVVIPVFNDEAGTKICLAALAVQTYPRFEVIVVDNGSHPPIQLPLDSYSFKVRVVICHVPGSYAARNAGVGAAGGDILAFTDADCVPAPGWIENAVEALLSAEHVVVGGQVLFAPPAVGSGAELYQYATGFQQRENIEVKQFSATANLFCTRAQFAATGPFDERLLSCGDREWAWRAARHGYRFVYVENARVTTPPRTSLRSAIRQARRVEAGRMQLRILGLDHAGRSAAQPHRAGWQVVRWIMNRPTLSIFKRLRILAAAIAIKTATLVEGMRIRLGGSPERR